LLLKKLKIVRIRMLVIIRAFKFSKGANENSKGAQLSGSF